MPRDGSGVYTLPPGNPVVDGTVISTNWANPTMLDIAQQLNNVLTRDGIMGPVDPMRFYDGTVAAPTITFHSDPNTGIFRAGEGATSLTSNGVEVARFAGDKIQFFKPIEAPAGSLAYLPLAGGTMTGPIYGQHVGTFPAYSFTNDPDTGIYSTTPNQIGFGVGGTQAILMSSGAVEIGVDTYIKKAGPSLVLDGTGDVGRTIWGRQAGVNRWQLRIGDGNDSAGIDANNFALYRHDQAGTLVGTHIFAGFRSDGRLDVPFLVCGATSQLAGTTIYGGRVRALPLIMSAGEDWATGEDATWRYFQYGAGWSWGWNKGNGTLQWNAGGIYVYAIQHDGFLSIPRLAVGNDGGFSLQKGGDDSRFLYWASGAAYMQWAPSGTWYFVNGSTTVMSVPYGQSGPTIHGASAGWRFENITNATLNAIALGRNINDNSIRFRVDGTQVGGVIMNVSDIGLKQDIVALVNDEAKFMAVSPINFRWRDDPEGVYSSEKLQEGFSAQNVQESFPDMIMEGEHLGINHFGLIARLWSQVKYLTQRVAQLESA